MTRAIARTIPCESAVRTMRGLAVVQYHIYLTKMGTVFGTWDISFAKIYWALVVAA